MRLLMLVWLIAVPAAFGEAPFAFNSTPGKLPKTVVPRHYTIRLEPDLDKFTTHGLVTVDLDVLRPVSEITLNTLDLEVSRATLAGPRQMELQPRVDRDQQTLTLPLPQEIPPGKYRLELEFSGRITEQAQGLFYVKYASPSGRKIILGTQMEPTDARRMFPCWDEPSFRAVFELTVVVPEKHLAVSNMPIEREQNLGNGRKEVKFRATPPMASYLVVLVAGELEELPGEAEGVKLRVITTEGKREQGRYALDAAKQVLAYYNRYFGIKYPLPKLDLIAVPGGFDGAMENWGGMTFEESLLLFDPKTSSEQTRRDIFVTVSHEMAHQWFGNLVTMAWWNDLWLNEGFATWMQNKATDHFHPGWDIWLGADGEKGAVMSDDATSSTHAIENEVTSESDAGDAFDNITYEKGEAFLRMLEDYVGEAQFRRGVHRYLAAHKYSNTTGADLWNALAAESGKPVKEMAGGWTEQPGLPVVKVAADRAGGRQTVSLTQERFTVDYADAAPQWWTIPISWADTAHLQAEKHLLLEEVRANRPLTFTLRTGGEVIELNPRSIGYYRVEYDPALFQKLEQRAVGLPPAGQLTLAGDTWAMVQAGRASVTNYLGLAETLSSATTFAVWDQVISVLESVDSLEQGRPGRAAFQSCACKLLQAQWRRLGWEPRRGESTGDVLLRSRVIGALGHFGDQAVIATARQHFERFLQQPDSLPADLRAAVADIVGRYSDRQAYEALHNLARHAPGTEERQRYYRAMTAALDPDLARETLAISLADETVPQEAANLVAQVAANGEHTELAWDFAKRHAKQLLAKVDAFSRNDYLSSILDSSNDPDQGREMLDYVKAEVSEEALARAQQTADQIRFRAAFKQRVVPEIDRWVTASGDR
jgi:aminopeptidase N